MTEIDVLFACVPVARLEAAIDWYGRLFGRPADIVPNDGEVMWRLADAAWLYVLQDEQRAGHGIVTLCVSDLIRTLAELGGRGMTSGPVEQVGGSASKSTIVDPDGNRVSLIEVTASE